MDKVWRTCGSDWKRPCPEVPCKHFGPPACKNVHTTAIWNQNRHCREDCEWAGTSSAPRTGISRLRFEKTAGIAIQRNPQHRFRSLGIATAGVDGVGMTSHESNPPRKNHYN